MIKNPMMLLVGDQEIDDFTLIKKQIDGIKRAGFDAICLEFRRCRYNELTEKGQETIRFCYEYAKRCGLKFVKIIPHYLTEQLVKYPFLKNRLTKKLKITIKNGECQRKTFDCFGQNPMELIAAFQEKSGVKMPGNRIPFRSIRNYFQTLQNGKYVLYFGYETETVDFSDEKSWLIAKDFVDILKDYSLDGFAIDEFGAGSRLKDCYLVSDAFLQKFYDKYGYRFEDRLYLMDARDKDFEFAKVRYDYYNLTEDITYDYQKRIKELFTNQFGENLFIGFHHTWVGEGNSGDLWAGDMDYFRLADNLSGGFVDAQYDSERTMNSLGLFAESIAEFQNKPAYNMCWDRYTTPEKFDYFHRLLAVRNQNWVGHAVSKTVAEIELECNLFIPFVDKTCMWGDVEKGIARSERFSSFIGGARADAKVAIVYTWESCAYFNEDYMHYHRLSIKALADKLIINNIPAVIVPSEIETLDDFETVFIPWGTMMPPKLWENIKKRCEKNKKTIFFGPAPRVTTKGENISREFFELLHISSLAQRDFCGGYECFVWDLLFNKNIIPMRAYVDGQNRMIFKNGNISYYGFELPLTDEFYNVLTELSSLQTISSDKVISKTYCSEYEKIICITSRWQSKINEEFMFDGLNVKIEDGILVGLKTQNGKLKAAISERGAKILVNGMPVEYGVIE